MIATLLGASFLEPVRAGYRFDLWGIEEGLPQQSVYGIVQTRDGYLWLATFDGLVRFDGLRMTVFEKDQTPGIESNRFLALHEDAQGVLWAATDNGRVTRHHRGGFLTYGVRHGLSPKLVIRDLYEDASGVLGIHTESGSYRWVDGAFVPASSPRRTHRKILQYKSSDGVWDVDLTRLRCETAAGTIELSPANGLPSLDVRSVAQDEQGNLWILTPEALTKVARGGVTAVLKPRQELPGEPHCFLVGTNLNIVGFSNPANMWCLRASDLTLQWQSPLPADLPHPDFLSSLADREGNIWFGTRTRGLVQMQRQIITVYSQKDGLAGDLVYPIMQDRSGAVWIAGNGITRYQDGKFTPIVGADPNFQACALLEDRHGRIWVPGHYNNFLVNKHQITDFPPELVPSRSVYSAVHEEPDGTLWFGHYPGLILSKGGVTREIGREEGFPLEFVSVFLKTRDGSLWIGGRGGLVRWHQGVFESHIEWPHLPDLMICSLYEDQDGALWIGSRTDGLLRFREGKFHQITRHHGLFDNGVFQILDDLKGNFWMSSNRGIYRAKQQELNELANGRRAAIECVSYGKRDGLLNPECNGSRSPAGIRTQDGKLWFPTMQGVAVIDPETVLTNPLPPPIYIESVWIDGQPAASDGAVKVPPGRHPFEIRYTGISFINPQRMSFQYRLESWDADWIRAGTRRSAFYSHVEPGRYRFTARAANSDGVWNETGASIDVIIAPMWHQTWWFRGLAAIAVAGGAFGFYRNAMQRQKRAQQIRELFSFQLINSQETERQRIAAELHDSLGQSLMIIRNRALLCESETGAGPNVIHHLHSITRAASDAITSAREICQNLRPIELDRLGLSKTLHAVAERMIAAAELQAEIEIEPIDSHVPVPHWIHILRILQEAITNAVKHAQASRIEVFFREDESCLKLWITDNGIGWNPEATADRRGFGIDNLLERARLCEGSLRFESAPNSGTTVLLELPRYLSNSAAPKD